MTLPPDTPLSDVIDWLFENARTGTTCPACTRRVKIDPYSIESGWIDVLAKVDADPDEWVHLQKYKTGSRKEPLLRHWGLLERQQGRREDGNPSRGYYRITDRGRLFLRGRLQVPRRILTGLGVTRYEDETDLVDVHAAYGHRFHYDEFMRGEG
jgi:hypothetical protein